ncbi:hypothetical protein AMTRI_Chr05g69040 [Amborella trichopoda]
MVSTPGFEDDVSAKGVLKRYEGLRLCAQRPLKARELGIGLISSTSYFNALSATLFSASNPSRTASEHPKRGTCPNFTANLPKPLSSFPTILPISPPSLSAPIATSSHSSRKRNPVDQKAAFTISSVPSNFAEETLWDSVNAICNGGVVQRCAGIVTDRFKAKALRNLESENHWMLPLFQKVAENCIQITNFFNSKAQLRAGFEKLQLQELDQVRLIRVLPENHFFGAYSGENFPLICPTLDDIMATARALQLADPLAREVANIIGDMGFWNELEAVLSLTKLIKTMAEEIETGSISWRPTSPLVVFQRVGDRGSVVSRQFGEGDRERERGLGG